MNLKEKIRSIPDYPKQGIMFRDITTLLKDAASFGALISSMEKLIGGQKIDKIAAPEARGFVLGAPLAVKLGAGFVPLRKPGKLPAASVSHEYFLEYGSDALEMHADAINSGDRVLLVDDLLATGGTILASKELIAKCGGEVVAACFAIELTSLRGRDALDIPVYSVIQFEGE